MNVYRLLLRIQQTGFNFPNMCKTGKAAEVNSMVQDLLSPLWWGSKCRMALFCTTYILEIGIVTLSRGFVAKSDWIYFFSSLFLSYMLVYYWQWLWFNYRTCLFTIATISTSLAWCPFCSLLLFCHTSFFIIILGTHFDYYLIHFEGIINLALSLCIIIPAKWTKRWLKLQKKNQYSTSTL